MMGTTDGTSEQGCTFKKKRIIERKKKTEINWIDILTPGRDSGKRAWRICY